jgi:hypothetical protein
VAAVSLIGQNRTDQSLEWGRVMALAVTYRPRSMDVVEYTQALEQLERLGMGSPRGRKVHVCFGAGIDLRVFSVWDTEADLLEFQSALVPVVDEIGLDLGSPEVEEVQNIITG